eukprot:1158157-Pelagomonas_calceolata.AAC.15
MEDPKLSRRPTYASIHHMHHPRTQHCAAAAPAALSLSRPAVLSLSRPTTHHRSRETLYGTPIVFKEARSICKHTPYAPSTHPTLCCCSACRPYPAQFHEPSPKWGAQWNTNSCQGG